MKGIKSLLITAGLALVFYAAGPTGVRAQALHLTVFSGTAQLPSKAEWQGKTLPAGKYALYYGTRTGGTHFVEIEGKTEGTPHLFITPQAYSPSSSAQNELVCTRVGDRLVVLELQMSGIGESLSFARSHGAQRTARQTAGSALRHIVVTETQIQRVLVTMQGK